MDAITQNLYGLLGVEPTASMPEIKKAYRKKALTCHPDKNPDNPRAAELFQELSRVLEILTDTNARVTYDQAIAARKQAKERVRQFDAKRKKLKEDLKTREEDLYKRSLEEYFLIYGDAAVLVISSTKKGSAMIEFEDKIAAETALIAEIGLAENPLKLRGLWDTQKRSTSAASSVNTLWKLRC
ncbi:DnaJ like protein subfamily C member 17 [Cyphomyrmex costatus]|uniref:DnaJ homolog subfamily C member 17 n=1 Tax=Cyphomyrmex costatus TaxID=456900 RepID=A0A195CML4_9HYME|nr:DnaJ like protein subfamily C member 17 [Cyphomyrmex costatus]